MDGIEYPVNLKYIDKFENQTQPYPLQYSDTKKRVKYFL